MAELVSSNDPKIVARPRVFPMTPSRMERVGLRPHDFWIVRGRCERLAFWETFENVSGISITHRWHELCGDAYESCKFFTWEALRK